MAVCSYLAYPLDGQGAALRYDLERFPECEIYEAEEHDLLLVVSDTPNRKADVELQEKISGLKSLKCLAMVFMSENAEGASV